MQHATIYWIATIARGLFALSAALVLVLVPQLTATVLLLPLAVVVAALTLAAYVTLDSVVVLLAGLVLRGQTLAAPVLAAQGALGVVLGASLFYAVHAHESFPWLVLLLAAQSLAAAFAEFRIARHHFVPHAVVWCYLSSAIAAFAGVLLFLTRGLPLPQLAWVLGTTLGLFGANQLALAGRMLVEQWRMAQQVPTSSAG
ncbi:MAG: hypothetical protein KGK08_00465 [Acidobacteriota bacterium]|nr:hypothetical protein [Acidobacteriota bacterium]